MLCNVLVPRHYFRGTGVLAEIGGFCKTLADKVLLVGGQKALQVAQTEVLTSLRKAKPKKSRDINE